MSNRTRPYFILLNPNDQNPRTAYNIAERLNSVFHATAEPNLKVGNAQTREIWDRLLERFSPVRRVLLTHYHPDHAGNAEWLCRRWWGLT